MTNSEFCGIIEDFLWDIKQFQKYNGIPEAEELYEIIIDDLCAFDDILRMQEKREPDNDA